MGGKPKENKVLDDKIFIGSGSVKTYMMAIITAVVKGKQTKVTLVGRGRACSRVIDVAQYAKNDHGYDIQNVAVDTEVIDGEVLDKRTNQKVKRKLKLSTIEIVVVPPK